jgi:serine/threonine protein kinase
MNDINFLTMCKYKIIEKIGEGTYGKVYKVNEKKTDRYHAMKKIKVPNLRRKEKKYLINEIAIQKLHTCPFIIKYIDGFFHKKSIYIISEFASKGDLSHLIKYNKKNKIKLSNKQLCKYFLQTVIGINYLHNNNIIHRDIKPSNIFLDQNDNIKIGDLGISTIFEKHSMIKTVIGTPYYMSPELFKHNNYSIKVDIWALGCLLYELITYNPPFLANNMNQLRYKILYNTVSPINCYKSKHFYEFNKIIYKLLNKSSYSRPETIFLLKNKFLIKSSEINPSEFIFKKDIIDNKQLIPKIPLKTILWGNIMSQINKVIIKDELIFDNIEKKCNKLEPIKKIYNFNKPKLIPDDNNIKLKPIKKHQYKIPSFKKKTPYIDNCVKLKPINNINNKNSKLNSIKKKIIENSKNKFSQIKSRIQYPNKFIFYPNVYRNKKKLYRNNSNINLFNQGYKNNYITEYSKYY